jgi:hypothetical protein
MGDNKLDLRVSRRRRWHLVLLACALPVLALICWSLQHQQSQLICSAVEIRKLKTARSVDPDVEVATFFRYAGSQVGRFIGLKGSMRATNCCLLDTKGRLYRTMPVAPDLWVAVAPAFGDRTSIRFTLNLRSLPPGRLVLHFVATAPDGSQRPVLVTVRE